MVDVNSQPASTSCVQDVLSLSPSLKANEILSSAVRGDYFDDDHRVEGE